MIGGPVSLWLADELQPCGSTSLPNYAARLNPVLIENVAVAVDRSVVDQEQSDAALGCVDDERGQTGKAVITNHNHIGAAATAR